MHSHRKLTRYFWDILAIIFILWGIFALLTPLTPASWLLLIGLTILFGRKKTRLLIAGLIGEKWFTKLKIDELLKKSLDKLGLKRD